MDKQMDELHQQIEDLKAELEDTLRTLDAANDRIEAINREWAKDREKIDSHNNLVVIKGHCDCEASKLL